VRFLLLFHYVGATHQEFDKRHKNHRSGKYTKSFTSKANDWIGFFVLSINSYDHAIRIEKSHQKNEE